MDLRIIPSFIQELLEAGINVSLTKDSFIVDGFYKSGTVEVECIGGEWIAKGRYGSTEEIREVKDIVALNHDWWEVSKDRQSSWSQPDSRWLPLLVQYGFVTAKVIPEQIVYE